MVLKIGMRACMHVCLDLLDLKNDTFSFTKTNYVLLTKNLNTHLLG